MDDRWWNEVISAEHMLTLSCQLSLYAVLLFMFGAEFLLFN